MKILLAVDGSPYTKHMLAYLAAHDELLGQNAEFTVLTVVPPLPAQVTHFIDHAAIDRYYSDQADAVLKPIMSFSDQRKWRPAMRQEVGHVAETIVRVAETGRFDLLVMGSHGHSALGAWAVGSVTSGVLSRCKVPLLIVPRQND